MTEVRAVNCTTCGVTVVIPSNAYGRVECSKCLEAIDEKIAASKTNGREPANPTLYMPTKAQGRYKDDDTAVTKDAGMTKREAFAMAALQGLCANSSVVEADDVQAAAAVGLADALLKELEA